MKICVPKTLYLVYMKVGVHVRMKERLCANFFYGPSSFRCCFHSNHLAFIDVHNVVVVPHRSVQQAYPLHILTALINGKE
jgi:hypothetical protein